VAILAARQSFSAREYRSQQKRRVFASCVKMQLARGSQNRMPVENHDFLPLRARQFLQPFAEFDFLASKLFVTEAAQFPKTFRLAKNKRARHPTTRATYKVPQSDDQIGSRIIAFQFHRAATGEASTGFDATRDVGEKLRARMRIRVHKNQPVSGRGGSSGIAGAGDLVDGLESDNRSCGLRQFRRSIFGIVIANDDFRLPVFLRKHRERQLNVLQSFTNQPFFIECWDDN
jgi:hypothetical protein